MVKILMVEDSAFEREGIKNFLRKYNYIDVIEAVDGYEGVKKYKEQKPDLVLLDLKLPGMMNGFDVFREIRKINPSAKCIVVSINRSDDIIKKAMEMGINYYIDKPVTESKLIPVIKEVLGK
ncbi:MAG: two-component system response regulator [Candidatus Aenigmarchaeota archaeon CG_4_10_14_0_8_um_filter_37_24]|nr:response regulator [Candidatus Aenigmarchaeota archaeon]OIN86202.1 MAG: hypothetical protein AUJ50_03960 [Candidatus Aenigmarchaeota archaeon CG1_02_38_14]PIV69106.1 MAG: two-component system response regulator [Candidatus Aenigmarchaeota archaeon CG01_land_8_20_14_3_00_37_9]PIW41641.1 MAG: two-component system response regulator [Candidatus Aenigmarchaeota archaeon CG15_BIG_FIL_POST_REV_8_21_14_020_37_27]PIX50704.1 MAG: two-component system response regulator [Candidatus Aenigmarchaeota arc